MYGQKAKQVQVDHEMMRWLLLIVLAILLVLFTTRSSATHPVDPTDVATVTTRVEATLLPDVDLIRRIGPGRSVPRLTADCRWQTPTARRLWGIFELHRKRELDEAIKRWQELSLFPCDQPWRTVAVGAAYLQLGDFDNALCVLSQTAEPNAVTFHLRGVNYWMNGRVAAREGKLYLAEEHRSDARKNFNTAIAMSTQVKLDKKLGLVFTKFVGAQSSDRYRTIFPEELLPPSTPRISDLLSVLNLHDYVAKSHLGLAAIALNDGLLEEVEDHLDDAADAGAKVADLYIVLGETLESEGESMAAKRVFMKAMTGKQKVGPRKMNPLD